MNAVLAETPALSKDKTVAMWKKLGHLTDTKIRELSTLHGAKAVQIDDTVEFKVMGE